MEQPRLRGAIESIPAYRAGKKASAGAYKVSSNENPYPPLPGVVAAVLDAASTINRYPDFGSERLVAALAAHHGVDESRVAVGTGSVAVLAQTIQAVASVGDEVVIPWRSFEAYPILVQLSGASLVRVALRPDHRLDLSAMASAITERTTLVMVCSPNNPTGTVVTQDELRDFLRRVPAHVLVALDEAYVEFVDPDQALDPWPLLDDHPNLVVLRTFSKAYGLAGLRVGYAVSNERVASALRKTQLPFGVSSVAEQAALASLASREALMKRVFELVRERTRVSLALAELGVDFPPSQGNFVWLPLADAALGFAAECEAHGLTVRAFAGDGVRVTIGEPEANDRFIAVMRRGQ